MQNDQGWCQSVRPWLSVPGYKRTEIRVLEGENRVIRTGGIRDECVKVTRQALPAHTHPEQAGEVLK
jgi:hypothetical protein